MPETITIQELGSTAFAPFGEVIDTAGEPDMMINQGKCARYADRATFDVTNGKVGLHLFNAEPRNLPLELEMMERHPDGSQCFVPMSQNPFLVVVAPDDGGAPGRPIAFRTGPGQAINYHRNTWHGVCCPLYQPGLFAVIDRVGPGPNLEEHWFDEPYLIT